MTRGTMDEHTNPPLSDSPNPIPVPQQDVPSTLPLKRKFPILYIAIAVFFVLGISVSSLLFIQTANTKNETPLPTGSPTVTLFPSPPSNLSSIASTSAFATFTQEIASFSSILDSFTIQDSTLTPPLMDTDLELSE